MQMDLIIELRINNILQKDGAFYSDINTRYDKFHAKIFNLFRQKLYIYNDLEEFNKRYDDPLLVCYNPTDIEFIKCISYSGFHNVNNGYGGVQNRYLKMQAAMHLSRKLDRSHFGVRYIDKIHGECLCNIARLILTSPLPFECFVSEDFQYIHLPVKDYDSCCETWKIDNKERLLEIVNLSTKHRDILLDIKKGN